MTAREIAIAMIKPYVERGETIQQLKAGMMGSYDDNGAASISGWIGDKKYNSDFILVKRIGSYKNGHKIEGVFKLQEIFDEIKQGQLTLV